MKIEFQRDEGGYALDALTASGVEGTVIDKPFILLTGHNGSGKSALLRGMRSSTGVYGERSGHSLNSVSHSAHDARSNRPITLCPKALGWAGQETYLYDSRATSVLAKASTFDDDDMLHHITMIAGGGGRVSHGQFVVRDWFQAIEWAAAPVKDNDKPAEKWLFIDEPETAIDSEKLIIGFATLLALAEIGRLRVFCASHSLLFANGLTDHPKMQTVDLGGDVDWLSTTKIALGISANAEKLNDLGQTFAEKLTKTHRGA